METDPDDVKDDLRAELLMLLQDLKRLEYVGVAEIERFLSSTFELEATVQVPKLRKFIARMKTVKASFMPAFGGRHTLPTIKRSLEAPGPERRRAP